VALPPPLSGRAFPVNQISCVLQGAATVLRSSSPSVPSTALARQLSRWLPTPADATRQDVAERLGQWLNVKETIALHTAQAGIAAAGRSVQPAPAAEVAALQQRLQAELQRVRSVLTASITARDASHQPDPNDLDLEFALLHQRLNDQQRRMELSVDALRGHVRQQLARCSPQHAQLAALDQQMEQLFGGREQRLLTGLPAHLKARYQTLRREAAASDTPVDLAWLRRFEGEFEQTLLAELDLRLQPVTGLIEALDT